MPALYVDRCADINGGRICLLVEGVICSSMVRSAAYSFVVGVCAKDQRGSIRISIYRERNESARLLPELLAVSFLSIGTFLLVEISNTSTDD